ncbi:double-strand break repair helicase AddA [Falsirhodobacter halotolerans]|uniref:double-strand break repair helicase AddA n=1 Tax=Falsirhodobacter halotolerans TaxID=1146892 RepID=UPI001FCFCC58|nr:double-strand break repair helicase AddA [Falsirhodobacter halotolerans]MCJ8140826.1 double-strand break repair helicase AddA [Falsirhodobacter halotolerans]
MSAMDDATRRQITAARPDASTWLSANAGSGKTRVLTDRVARLLLDGVAPQRVLCLTYTKAAATEMQNRLFRRLGEWAMLEDGPLAAALTALGVPTPAPDTLARARRLFARAIETPGGLRIQTIHSFCASLLRRFPLEAGVSPQFTEMDDRAARLLRAEIVEDMADRLAPEAVAGLARSWTGEDFERLTDQIAATRDGFGGDVAAAAGLPEGVTADTLLADVFLGGEAEWLGQIANLLAAGSATEVKAAPRLRIAAPDMAALAELEGVLLNGAKAEKAGPFTAKVGTFPTKGTRATLGPLQDRLEDLMRRVETARPLRLALRVAERSRALHAFAAVFLPEYDRRKSARGWLDFDDLIRRTGALLNDPSVAEWVLFRLDGGIDHILVDEAQDTSPQQWQVIERLAQEFSAGEGARDVERTIFVVGDKKQSIYSFQGADVAAFDRMKTHFAARLDGAGVALQDLQLEHSFRSSSVVLDLVDRTFADAPPQAVGGAMHHIAFRDIPGRVDLWPVIDPSDTPEDEDWSRPVDLISDEHHHARLASQIARRIARMIEQGVQIPEGGGMRPCHAGDFLILVRGRGGVFNPLIRACKAAGLPIAGADRLKLAAELAVKDLTALLAFLATPEDDLSLAALLKSPLFGWSEDALFRLAHGRTGYLWAVLRGTDDPAVAVLGDMRNHADFLRPYDLIERMLTRHDGRRRLLARLGAEAEDGIDELLSQAMAYERTDVPSLTGFLSWLTSDEVEVKRRMDGAGRMIRVMTVHGAKGLEAPIVILPDLADHPVRDRADLIPMPEGPALWKASVAEAPPTLAATLADRAEASKAESLRLLYVALTRAQCWLIAAAAGKVADEGNWYNRIRRGMEAAGAVPWQGGLRLEGGIWPDPAPGATETVPMIAPLPNWARVPAHIPPHALPPLSPSDLGGAKALPGEGLEEEAAKLRGTHLHLLLEHLPQAEDRAATATRLLPDTDTAPLMAEVEAVLAAHQGVFAADTLAEVTVTADLDGTPMMGVIDRLIVMPDRVLAVDFKTNATVPATPDQVPEGLLRQMGAYARALAAIYPDRGVETAILWTRTGALMPLPDRLTSAALARALTAAGGIPTS